MVTIDMALWQLLLKWRLGSFAQLATWQFSKTKLKWRLGRYGAPSLGDQPMRRTSESKPDETP
jgi:hypothetical protein